MWTHKLYTLLALLLPGMAAAQLSQLTAEIYDANNEAVIVGNAIIIDQDSQMVKGDVFYDGQLQLEWEYQPDHYLQISSLGWETKTIPLKGCPNGCDFGRIELGNSAFDLEEVVITDRARIFKAVDGNIMVNVENTILGEKETVLDILRNSPGILIQGGNINIIGKGTPQIYVDGVEVTDMNVLKSITPSEIKNIEIIRNPTAKYDAQGKAVINIYTRNSNLEGILGQMQLRLNQATHLSGTIVGNFSYKKDRLSFYAGALWNPYQYTNERTYERSIAFPDGISTLYNDITTNRQANLNSSYRVKVGYDLTDKQKVTLETKGRFRQTNISQTNSNNVNPFDESAFSIVSLTDGQNDYDFNTTTATHQYNISDDRKLNTIFSYTNVNNDRFSDIGETIGDLNERLSRSIGENDYSILIGRMDYEQPLFSNYKLETGLKFSTARNQGVTTLEREQDGILTELPEYGVDYSYEEENYAAYTTVRRDWGKFSARLGLRYEYVLADGAKTGVGNFIDRSFSNLFPTASMSYEFSENASTSVYYSKRIQRPGFSSLDPTVEYLDAYSILKGNPELLPELTDNVEFSFFLFDYPVLTLGYTDSQDPTSLVVEKDPNNELVNVGINRNLDYRRAFSANLTLPYQFDWWTTAIGGGFERQFVRYNESFNNGKELVTDFYYLFSNQDFTVGDGWNFGANFYWYSDGRQGILSFESAHRLDAWVGKKFNDGKWIARLYFDDMLRSDIEAGGLTLDNIYVRETNYYDARRVRLSLTHRFGSLKKSTGGRSNTSDEFNRISND